MKRLDKDDFKEIMAALTLTATFTYMFMVTFIPVPKESQRFADVILGSLLTLALGKVLSAYFDKDKKEDAPKD